MKGVALSKFMVDTPKLGHRKGLEFCESVLVLGIMSSGFDNASICLKRRSYDNTERPYFNTMRPLLRMGMESWHQVTNWHIRTVLPSEMALRGSAKT